MDKARISPSTFAAMRLPEDSKVLQADGVDYRLVLSESVPYGVVHLDGGEALITGPFEDTGDLCLWLNLDAPGRWMTGGEVDDG